MLKHCSPSSVDIRRRSRRNLLTIVDDSVAVGFDQCQEDMIVTDHALVMNGIVAGGGSDELNDDDVEFDTTSVRSYSTSTSCSSGLGAGPRSKTLPSRHKVVLSLSSDKTSCLHNSYTAPPPPVIPKPKHKPSKSSSTHPKSGESPKKSQQQQLSQPVKIPNQRIPIKIYSRCLCSDIEYKTLSINHQTTSREVIWMLLSKFKMRHRDPKLFYLTMDINIKRTGIPLKKTLSLEEDSRPAELKSCHPWGECRFTLQMKKGGLVRIHASVLMPESKYKCLLLSETTTVAEAIKILFHCYGLSDSDRISPDQYELHERCQELERRLHPDDQPVVVQTQWSSAGQFVLRKSPDQLPSSSSHFHQAIMMVDPEEFVDGEEFRPATELADIVVEEVVTSVDDVEYDEEDSKCNSGRPHDTSCYSSGAESTSSDYSVLRFRDSPMSTSSRSKTSTASSSNGGHSSSGIGSCDSGAQHTGPQTLPPPPPPPPPPPASTKPPQLPPKPTALCGLEVTIDMCRRNNMSLKSLLASLPAESVDVPSSPDIVKDKKTRKEYLFDNRLSDISATNSLESGDFDSYFYI